MTRVFGVEKWGLVRGATFVVSTTLIVVRDNKLALTLSFWQYYVYFHVPHKEVYISDMFTHFDILKIPLDSSYFLWRTNIELRVKLLQLNKQCLEVVIPIWTAEPSNVQTVKSKTQSIYWNSKFTASPEGLTETNNITNTVSPFLFQRTENQIKALTPKHFHWFQLNIKRSTVA